MSTTAASPSTTKKPCKSLRYFLHNEELYEPAGDPFETVNFSGESWPNESTYEEYLVDGLPRLLSMIYSEPIRSLERQKRATGRFRGHGMPTRGRMDFYATTKSERKIIIEVKNPRGSVGKYEALEGLVQLMHYRVLMNHLTGENHEIALITPKLDKSICWCIREYNIPVTIILAQRTGLSVFIFYRVKPSTPEQSSQPTNQSCDTLSS